MLSIVQTKEIERDTLEEKTKQSLINKTGKRQTFSGDVMSREKTGYLVTTGNVEEACTEGIA